MLTDEQAGARDTKSRRVKLTSGIPAGAEKCVLTPETKTRVTIGNILYHPLTKERLVIEEMDSETGVCRIRIFYFPSKRKKPIRKGATLYILECTTPIP